MRISGFAKALLHTALLLTVLMVIGDIHGHQCLDGREPALSVHFETFNGHPDHAAADHHDDIDSDLQPQGLTGKAPNQDATVFLLACSLLCMLRPQPRRLQYTRRDLVRQTLPPTLLPPSRAPPVLSNC